MWSKLEYNMQIQYYLLRTFAPELLTCGGDSNEVRMAGIDVSPILVSLDR